MKVNLKGKTRKELEKLKVDIDKQLAKLAEDEKKVALAAAEKAAKAHGFSLKELSGVKPGRKAAAPKKQDGRSKVAPKYRNPDNASETWTGRGRKPKWVEAYMANGGELDNILI
ncbi:H-NS family nucleoid-associated regulatory protein [Maritimibacter dapengensis]|uniref:H-NS histone family protein n=1 Tax=Maritimibacter dapengensis TaxID=2836868 RepID=A0ABS6SXR5_9RHOB|nr:H-NS histone family protein [Maritimibacter dapengensis]MBV7377754.1 H-NS histone family protein [Maritimibacter dapengensis]